MTDLEQRAATALREHIESRKRDERDREAGVRRQITEDAHLSASRLLGVPESAISWGEAVVAAESRTGTLNMTVDGLTFRWVREHTPSYTTISYLALVRQCPKCRDYAIERVNFLYEVGALLEVEPHEMGCPVVRFDVPAPTPRRPMSDAEERLLVGLFDVLRERGIPAPE